MSGPTPGCVYCLGNGLLQPAQVLWRGRSMYLAAPRGQLVEGYLAIAPLACRGTFSGAGADVLDELTRFMGAVEAFHRAAYGAEPLFYEQGRAGDGQAEAGFPLHAHLCALPVQADLHPWLAARFDAREVPGIAALPAGEPYVYVQQAGRARCYTGADAAARAALRTLRLKPVIAERLGLPGRGDWRAWPGDEALASLLARWAAWQR